MPIRSVVFDVGETIMKDDTYWGLWADWLGVPRHTLSALVGTVTSQGLDNAEALRLVRPGIDIEAERAAREASGRYAESIGEADLYPDTRTALAALQRDGYWVGIVGNQTARAAQLLRSLDLPADAIATSGEWGAAKPSAAFFDQVTSWAPGLPHEIVYVGDHRDNDILPAHNAGLRTAHVHRGPWGYSQANDPALVAAADWRVDSLNALVTSIRGL